MLTLRRLAAARHVRVNAVNPGLVGTEGTRSAGVVGGEFETGGTAMALLGRIGTPEDVAAAVASCPPMRRAGSPARR